MDKGGSGIKQYEMIKYLSNNNAIFTGTPGGFLALKLELGEEYPRINLYRAFPISHEREYISVRDTEGKEIGIIRNIDEYPEETVRLLEEQLERRYFAPVIEGIRNIKDEFGYSYWDVMTNVGESRFTVKGSEGIKLLDSNAVYITDVDGNRFEVPDYRALDDKSLRKLERYI